jgi:hypothetical protein
MRETFGFTLVALLVIVDPFGTAVIFASMTTNNTAAERRRQAIRATVIERELLTIPPLPQAEAEPGAASLPNPSQPTGPAPLPRFPVLEPEPPAPTPAEAFNRSLASFPVLSLFVLGCLGLATLWSIGYGVSLVWRAIRRRPERNWP